MSVLARVLEANGITTVALALIKEHAERTKPPRALFVPFDFGRALGKANDTEFQHRVIAAAFDLLQYSSGPVLSEFPEAVEPAPLPQSSNTQAVPDSNQKSPADEINALRDDYDHWVATHNERTAVGLCGVPPQRFDALIAFLDAFAQGKDADLPERPSDVSVPEYIRYCVDDLKAFYYEARMAQHTDQSEAEIHSWFWGKTSIAPLIVSVGDRIGASGTADAAPIAYGIAR